MAVTILMGTLAAIGMLSILWVFLGGLLSAAKGGAVVCLGLPEEGFLRRYQWLRELGLLTWPLLIVTDEQAAERVLGSGIEICSPETLTGRLERERNHLDGTGNGDSPGRGQRRGISEL